MLVFANIGTLSAINFLTAPKKRFYSLKKTFPLKLKGSKGLKMVLEKNFPDLKIFPQFEIFSPYFPWFPWLEKGFQIFPDWWEPFGSQ